MRELYIPFDHSNELSYSDIEKHIDNLTDMADDIRCEVESLEENNQSNSGYYDDLCNEILEIEKDIDFFENLDNDEGLFLVRDNYFKEYVEEHQFHYDYPDFPDELLYYFDFYSYAEDLTSDYDIITIDETDYYRIN